jgi:hypothetical protein
MTVLLLSQLEKLGTEEEILTKIREVALISSHNDHLKQNLIQTLGQRISKVCKSGATVLIEMHDRRVNLVTGQILEVTVGFVVSPGTVRISADISNHHKVKNNSKGLLSMLLVMVVIRED